MEDFSSQHKISPYRQLADISNTDFEIKKSPENIFREYLRHSLLEICPNWEIIVCAGEYNDWTKIFLVRGGLFVENSVFNIENLQETIDTTKYLVENTIKDMQKLRDLPLFTGLHIKCPKCTSSDFQNVYFSKQDEHNIKIEYLKRTCVCGYFFEEKCADYKEINDKQTR